VRAQLFFDIKRIVHKEFVQAGQTAPHTTVTFYADCLKIYEAFALNFGDKRTGRCITTTQGLTCFVTRKFLTKNSMTDISHPRNFSLFLGLKIKLKGCHFDTIKVIETESQAVLAPTEQVFQNAFKIGRSSGNGAYAQNETTSRIMVTSRPKVSFHQMEAPVPEIMDVSSFDTAILQRLLRLLFRCSQTFNA
jgi:hypothetical protein